MIGRAGRPGFDTSGTAVIMTDNKSKEKYQKLATNGLSLAQSCFLAKKDEIMNSAISQFEMTSITEALSWLKQTLYCLQFLSDPATNHLPLDEHLLGICRDACSSLVKLGAIEVEDGEFLRPKPAGVIMSHSLVDIQAMEIMTQIPHDATQSTVLKAIANISGLQRPVRRHEKKVLNQTQ